MPDIVSFDGPNRIITVLDDVGNLEMEIDAGEIYSEWKVWSQANSGDNLRFLQAFAFVGGDPISATQSLGITYFLENGWRIRPAEKDHKLTIIGNIFTREEGESVFLSTLGTYTVNAETRVSNLIDSSVARLDLNQLLNAVYIDAVGGEAGTDEGIGNPTRPVNNVADAFTIATRDNLSAFVIRGFITLDRDVSDWRFTSRSSNTSVDGVDFGGHDISRCTFEFLEISGIAVGSDIVGLSCIIAAAQGLDGTFRDCGILSSLILDDNASASFISCVSLAPNSGAPLIQCGANVDFSLRNYSGSVRITNLTAGCSATVDLDPGHCILDSSCTGGTLTVRGTGNFTDESGAVAVTDLGLIEAVSAHTALVYRSATQQLDVATWIDRNGDITTPTGMQLDLYALDGVTLILSIDETNPNMTLTPAGWYAGTVPVSLQSQALYFAIVSVTDSRGQITRTKAAVSP